ncbi:MAG: hypothetical protein ACFE0O_08850 [Opitutales bacterium]
MDDLSKYLLTVLSAFLISLGITRLMISLGPKLGLIDHPDARRIHRTPIPRAGGLAVFLGFHLSVLGLYFLWWPDFQGQLDFGWWEGFFLASVLLLVVGLLDDARGLPPLVKLAGQAAAALALFLTTGSSFATLLGFQLPLALDLVLTVVWCLALINAFNLIDGMDGLCAGLAIVSGLGIAAAFVLRGVPGDGIVVLALIGACLGFLRYNFHPARIFLGDTGSMFIGFLMAAMALGAAGKSTVLVALGIPFLAAGVPVIDTVLAIWRRTMRRLVRKYEGSDDGPKVTGADRDHLHHRLLASGLSQRRVALLLYAANALLVVVALVWISINRSTVGLFLALFLGAAYVVIRHIVHIEVWDTGRAMVQGLKRPSKGSVFALMLPFWDLACLTLAFMAAFAMEDPNTAKALSLADWVNLFPFWVTPVFLMLVFFRAYVRVWTRSTFIDFLYLAIALGTGGVLAFALNAAWTANLSWSQLQVALVMLLLAAAGIGGIRSLPQLLREWMVMTAQEDRTGGRYRVKNLLLYGAGDRGSLFLRQLRFVHPDEMATRRVVGFIDDNRNLRRRYSYGVQVLGTFAELPRILNEHAIDEVIVTAALPEARLRELRAAAEAAEVAVYTWQGRTQPLAQIRKAASPQTLFPDTEQKGAAPGQDPGQQHAGTEQHKVDERVDQPARQRDPADGEQPA